MVALHLEANGEFTAPFAFEDGEIMELRQHYCTLGAPKRDLTTNRLTNAVLVLHGTTGSASSFLSPGSRENFALPLFGDGGPLDAQTHYIVLPDGIGHGKSSRPSEHLRMSFPQYTYEDMVKAQHQLLTEHLGVDHLLLVTGTSMGGMQTWIWGYTYPTFMDALFPLASLPIEIAGVNRMTRKAIVDAIVEDPAFEDGNYCTDRPQPLPGHKTAVRLMAVRMTSAPLQCAYLPFNTRRRPRLTPGCVVHVGQAQAPTGEQAEDMLDDMTTRLLRHDPCDMVYAFNASRCYNPAPHLLQIIAPLCAVNSADDQVNPPELMELEKGVERLQEVGRDARAVVLPVSEDTRGHGSHTIATLWQNELERLLVRARVAAAQFGHPKL